MRPLSIKGISIILGEGGGKSLDSSKRLNISTIIEGLKGLDLGDIEGSPYLPAGNEYDREESPAFGVGNFATVTIHDVESKIGVPPSKVNKPPR